MEDGSPVLKIPLRVPRRRVGIFTVAILAVALIAAACGGDDDAETVTPTSAPANTATTAPANTATTAPANTATAAPADTATAAPTDTPTAAPADTATSDPSAAPLQRLISVNAVNVAFDVSRLEAKAGEEVTINFFNFDDDTPHSFHITGPGGLDEKTEIFRGSEGRQRSITFVVTEPGEYAFVCDVHAFMTGTMTVE